MKVPATEYRVLAAGFQIHPPTPKGAGWTGMAIRERELRVSRPHLSRKKRARSRAPRDENWGSQRTGNLKLVYLPDADQRRRFIG
jgi:hypothetical protein